MHPVSKHNYSWKRKKGHITWQAVAVKWRSTTGCCLCSVFKGPLCCYFFPEAVQGADWNYLYWS